MKTMSFQIQYISIIITYFVTQMQAFCVWFLLFFKIIFLYIFPF
jgi:hypothetical protein